MECLMSGILHRPVSIRLVRKAIGLSSFRPVQVWGQPVAEAQGLEPGGYESIRRTDFRPRWDRKSMARARPACGDRRKAARGDDRNDSAEWNGSPRRAA